MEPVALVIGEALVDVVVRDGERVERAGGSAANAAVALARLGRPVRLATCLADDAHGALVREHLAAAGVALAGDAPTIRRTSSAVATIGADGAATYTFDLDWRPAPVGPGGGVAVAHTSSMAAVVEPGCETVHDTLAAARESATVSYDVNARPVLSGTGPEVRARVERLVAISDVVKASDEDLAAFYPGLSVTDAALALLDLGPAVVVVTLGGDGALWFAATGERGRVASVPVEVGDTIGAGDTFSAALLDALWRRGVIGAEHRAALHTLTGADWDAALAWAARAAAVTVSRQGADPPYLRELDA